jgi:hypothetical protein
MMKYLLFLTALFLATCAMPAQAAHLVFMIGEDEYHTWETLPEFAKKELQPLGHRVTIIQADAADKNHFPGLIEALRDADLLFVSVRRRTPHRDELDAVRAFLAAGKPLVGIRTASHAFASLPRTALADPKLAVWPEFDHEVLGGNYTGYHRVGAKTTLAAASGAESHPILAGVAVAKLVGHGELYKNTPLAADATPLLIGSVPGHAEPVAWTHRYGPKQARIFYSSLGAPADFGNPVFPRLLSNAIDWALDRPAQ